MDRGRIHDRVGGLGGWRSFGDLIDGTGTDELSAPSRMAKRLASLEGDGRDQLDRHLDGVAGHHHLGTVVQPDSAGDV